MTRDLSFTISSYHYLDGILCHPKKPIDGISTGAAKRLRQMCSNDNDFQEQLKKYSVYLSTRSHIPIEIPN